MSRYQINARTELAIRYNDISPLENHHCAVAFQILADPESNILSTLDSDDYKTVRMVSRCCHSSAVECTACGALFITIASSYHTCCHSLSIVSVISVTYIFEVTGLCVVVG